MKRLVVVGDAFLHRDLESHADRLCPDAPAPVTRDLDARARPGGPTLAAALAASDGRPVTLTCAIADDRTGEDLGHLLAAAGVEVRNLGCTGPHGREDKGPRQ